MMPGGTMAVNPSHYPRRSSWLDQSIPERLNLVKSNSPLRCRHRPRPRRCGTGLTACCSKASKPPCRSPSTPCLPPACKRSLMNAPTSGKATATAPGSATCSPAVDGWKTSRCNGRLRQRQLCDLCAAARRCRRTHHGCSKRPATHRDRQVHPLPPGRERQLQRFDSDCARSIPANRHHRHRHRLRRLLSQARLFY